MRGARRGARVPAARGARARRAGEPPVVLVGMPAVGKTTVGRLTAARLGLPFADLDDAVAQRTGMGPAQWIRRCGEAAFREVEARTLRGLLDGAAHAGLLVASGGGVVERDDNRRLLADATRCTCVWLDAPIEVVWARAARSARDRPLLVDRDSLWAQWRRRRPWYRAVARLRIDASGGAHEVVAALIAALQDGGPP